MRKVLVFFGLIICLFSSAQKRKYNSWQSQVKFSVDPTVTMLFGLGNNVMADALNPFIGGGFSVNSIIYKGFGLGIGYNYLRADIKKREMFGYLGFPRMNNFDLYLIHQDKISEDFFVEELIGYSTYRVKSPYLENSDTFSEGNGGLHFGGKAVYTLDMNGVQQIVLGGKLNFYNAKIANQNSEISDYYSRALFLNLSLSYRINF